VEQFSARRDFSLHPATHPNSALKFDEAGHKAWLSYETDTPAPKRAVSNPTHRQHVTVKDKQVARGVTTLPRRQGKVTHTDTTTTVPHRQGVYGPLPEHLTPSSKWSYTPKKVASRPSTYESFPELNRPDTPVTPLFPAHEFEKNPDVKKGVVAKFMGAAQFVVSVVWLDCSLFRLKSLVSWYGKE
jgi:hypothetical protein